MIRLAKLYDLNDILVIIKQAQQRMKNAGMTQWQNDYPNINIIHQDILDKVLYVYILDNKIVGTMSVFPNDPVYNHIEGAWLNKNPYMVIHRIAVLDAVIGKNISQQMIDFVFKFFNVTDIRIDTHPMNLPMIKSLKRQGFLYCGTIHVTIDTDTLRLAYHKHI